MPPHTRASDPAAIHVTATGAAIALGNITSSALLMKTKRVATAKLRLTSSARTRHGSQFRSLPEPRSSSR
jgi:hypothetical protein